MRLILTEFDSINEVAAEYRLEPNDTHPGGPGLDRERDWEVRATGWGHPKESRYRWLVVSSATGTKPPEDITAPGCDYLLAYELEDGMKTGRVLVILGPWNLRIEEIFYEEAAKAGVRHDLNALIQWLKLTV